MKYKDLLNEWLEDKLRITPPKSRSSVRIIPLNSTISYSVNLMQNSEDDTYVLTGTKRK